MTILEYRATGKLELYVAGVLSEDEMIAITKAIDENPEVKEEVEMIEDAFIKYASLHAPEVLSTPINNILNKKNTTPPVINGTSFFRTKAFCILGWSALIISLFFNYYQYNTSKEKSKTLETEQEIFAQDLDRLNKKYELTQKQFAEIRNPNTETILLECVNNNPKIQAFVYWDGKSEHAYIDISALPEPTKGNVYQFWWLDSLEPLSPYDGGIFNNYEENDQKVFIGKIQKEAVAFAITLEPEGGSKTPTLEELVVLGKI